MRPALGTAWSLHLHQDRAYVVRVGDGQRVAALDPCEAVIVGLMDGRRPIEAIAQALDQALGGAALPGLHRRLQARLQRLGRVVVATTAVPDLCLSRGPLVELAGRLLGRWGMT